MKFVGKCFFDVPSLTKDAAIPTKTEVEEIVRMSGKRRRKRRRRTTKMTGNGYAELHQLPWLPEDSNCEC